MEGWEIPGTNSVPVTKLRYGARHWVQRLSNEIRGMRNFGMTEYFIEGVKDILGRSAFNPPAL